jgi:uncharacterized protein (TIGR02145 family)
VTDSLFVPPLGTWYVFSYAVDTLYTYVCPVQGCTDASAANFNPLAVIEDGSCTYGPAQCGGTTTVTFDGHTYALVAIGTQCWFAENLRSDNYRNGDAIPGNLTDAQWASTGSGAQAVYNNDSCSLAMYGRLYNWYAVNDSRGLCPSGFHVPNDEEWMTLEMALGMTSSQANSTGWRGTDEGTQMKTSSWGGTNSSGFSALPGGYRTIGDGSFISQGNDWSFISQGNDGSWWSSSPGSFTYAWFRYLHSGYSSVVRFSYNPRLGFSVRCVQDSESDACFDPDLDSVCAEDEVSGCTDSGASNFNPEATENDGSCVYPGPAQCSSSITFDSHTYALVAIGTQCWFAENLRSDNYRNGEPIPGNLSSSEWASTVSGAQAVYNNDLGSLANYGRLYNWYAVNDSRGLCPSGFHVPSDGDWMTLEMALGMTSSDANSLGWRGTDQGTQMKMLTWGGTNSSGFSALPGGSRDFGNGNFYWQGERGYWWSSSPDGNYAWSRTLMEVPNVYRSTDFTRHGISVRCVRD